MAGRMPFSLALLYALAASSGVASASEINFMPLEDVVAEGDLSVFVGTVTDRTINGDDQLETVLDLGLTIDERIYGDLPETRVLNTAYREPTGIWIDPEGNVTHESPIVAGSGMEFTLAVGSQYVFLVSPRSLAVVRAEPLTSLNAIRALLPQPQSMPSE